MRRSIIKTMKIALQWKFLFFSFFTCSSIRYLLSNIIIYWFICYRTLKTMIWICTSRKPLKSIWKHQCLVVFPPTAGALCTRATSVSKITWRRQAPRTFLVVQKHTFIRSAFRSRVHNIWVARKTIHVCTARKSTSNKLSTFKFICLRWKLNSSRGSKIVSILSYSHSDAFE